MNLNHVKNFNFTVIDFVLMFRFLMLIMLSPLLSRVGYGIEWRNLIVMMWGKMRQVKVKRFH